jgi:hypothetical protein
MSKSPLAKVTESHASALVGAKEHLKAVSRLPTSSQIILMIHRSLALHPLEPFVFRSAPSRSPGFRGKRVRRGVSVRLPPARNARTRLLKTTRTHRQGA